MNKKLRSQIKAAYDAPMPVRRNEFLQSINFPKTGHLDFILGQIGYIRKRVWIISGLLAAAAIFSLRFSVGSSLNLIWIISSLLPFVSLVTVTELARSASYNMAEIEMSCKYNLSGIVLARLGILGSFNMLTVFAIIVLCSGEIGFDIFRAGIYLLVPFMLTCSLSLFTLNRFHSRETIYICGGISGFTSIASSVVTRRHIMIFSDEYLFFWIEALIVLIIWVIAEIMKLIKKTEELQWNLL